MTEGEDLAISIEMVMKLIQRSFQESFVTTKQEIALINWYYIIQFLCLSELVRVNDLEFFNIKYLQISSPLSQN